MKNYNTKNKPKTGDWSLETGEGNASNLQENLHTPVSRLQTILSLIIIAAAFLLISTVSLSAQVKVFILAGQSNMQGQGFVVPTQNHLDKNGGMGTLDYLVENGADSLYGDLKEGDTYKERADVWHYYDKGDNGIIAADLTVGQGTNPDRIGPELGFGQILGNHYDDQVLLIKTAWGGAALHYQDGNNFHPPSSDGETGNRYTEMMGIINDVLGDIGAHFPGYADQGHEIAGFGWHQGWNDGKDETVAMEYEENLVNFIKDVRTDLDIADLPFVVANSGFNGWVRGPGFRARIWDYIQPAQLAVGDPGLYPEFEGTVASVETRDFWFEDTDTPGSSPSHWNLSAESYYLIGDAMGKAMVGILGDPPDPVSGCMDTNYVEYNPNATVDDPGACVTLITVDVVVLESVKVKLGLSSDWTVTASMSGPKELVLHNVRGYEIYRTKGNRNIFKIPVPLTPGLFVIVVKTQKGQSVLRTRNF